MRGYCPRVDRCDLCGSCHPEEPEGQLGIYCSAKDHAIRIAQEIAEAPREGGVRLNAVALALRTIIESGEGFTE